MSNPPPPPTQTPASTPLTEEQPNLTINYGTMKRGVAELRAVVAQMPPLGPLEDIRAAFNGAANTIESLTELVRYRDATIRTLTAEREAMQRENARLTAIFTTVTPWAVGELAGRFYVSRSGGWPEVIIGVDGDPELSFIQYLHPDGQIHEICGNKGFYPSREAAVAAAALAARPEEKA